MPMQSLEEYRNRLSENIDVLTEINSQLKEEQISLFDAGEIELRSRSLGFRRQQNIRVNTPGYARSNTMHTLGAIVGRDSLKEGRQGLFRLIALGIGLAAFGLSFAFRDRK